MPKKRRHRRLTEDQRQEIGALRDQGLSLGEIATRFRISKGYVSRLTSPLGGAPTVAWNRWFEAACAEAGDMTEPSAIDQARRLALQLLRRRLSLEGYLKARADLDRLIAKIPPDEVLMGESGWIAKAIVAHAAEVVGVSAAEVKAGGRWKHHPGGAAEWESL